MGSSSNMEMQDMKGSVDQLLELVSQICLSAF